MAKIEDIKFKELEANYVAWAITMRQHNSHRKVQKTTFRILPLWQSIMFPFTSRRGTSLWIVVRKAAEKQRCSDKMTNSATIAFMMTIFQDKGQTKQKINITRASGLSVFQKQLPVFSVLLEPNSGINFIIQFKL